MISTSLLFLSLIFTFILLPLVLIITVAYIEYQRLECSIFWVKKMKMLVASDKDCYCRTCMANADEKEEVLVRDC
jgi:hypothetical protein